MLLILTYDIYNVSDRRRVLTSVYNICSRYLFRIQKSVFIGNLTKPLYKELRTEIESVIDVDVDSIMIVKLMNKNNAKIDFFW